MNTNSKKTTMFGAVIMSAALLAGTAVAGGQIHKLPADYGKTYPTYEFKIVNAPSARTPLTVQLVNRNTGQLVTDAHVTMQHTVWLGIKAAPQVQQVQLPLTPDGRGDYVCSRGTLRPGESVVLRGHVPGEPSATWTTIALND